MPKPCQHYNLSGYLLLRVPFSYIIIPISCALQLESEVFCDFTFDCCLLVRGWKTDGFSPRIILGDQSAGKPKQVKEISMTVWHSRG